MQRAAVVEGYRELAGITDPAVAIGPAPARQAGMSEAFAASVRALELADDVALLKAMGRGELASPPLWGQMIMLRAKAARTQSGES